MYKIFGPSETAMVVAAVLFAATMIVGLFVEGRMKRLHAAKS